MSEFDELLEEPDATIEPSTAEYKIADNIESQQPNRQQQILERLRIKSKILRYKEFFPKQLMVYEYRMENLDALSTEDLQDLLYEIQLAVSCRNSAGLIKSCYFSGIGLTERIGCAMNYKLQGLSEALQQSQEVHDCLNELSLKYEDAIYTSPEIRLANATLQAIIGLHKLNSSNITINDVLSKKVPGDLQDEFGDL